MFNLDIIKIPATTIPFSLSSPHDPHSVRWSLLLCTCLPAFIATCPAFDLSWYFSGYMVWLIDNKAISAKIELDLGISLATSIFEKLYDILPVLDFL